MIFQKLHSKRGETTHDAKIFTEENKIKKHFFAFVLTHEEILKTFLGAHEGPFVACRSEAKPRGRYRIKMVDPCASQKPVKAAPAGVKKQKNKKKRAISHASTPRPPPPQKKNMKIFEKKLTKQKK
jgi:hypothetical protein